MGPHRAAGLRRGQLLAEQDDSIVIKPRPAEETLLAVLDFQPKAGNTNITADDYLKTINETLGQLDLEYSAFFKLLGKSFYPSCCLVEPEDVDFKEWQNLNLGADFLVMAAASGSRTTTGGAMPGSTHIKTQEHVPGKQFRTIPRYARAIAHRIADHIVALLSANASKGIAASQIVFERNTRTGKEIYLMDYDGAGSSR